ncbi:peptide deformylase [Ruminococcaceae bacterium OttesenSCG-928-I18]|nr:peptide deformylase [Ruminococcaceae bacterium OttesenSCG-928-I18]
MALRNILLDGDPILQKKCRPVEKFDDRLAQLIDDMAETMIEGNGLGLAAPQVGVMRRVFVALEEPPQKKAGARAEEEDGQDQDDWVVHEFVNPEIIERDGEQYGYEGCLSFPGEFGAVKRPDKVVVRAQDRHGNTFTMEGQGLMARCFCHETDHLDGVTFDTLADYFYDPDVPHELDATLGGREEAEEE